MTRRQMDLPYGSPMREPCTPKASVTVKPDARCVDCLWLTGHYTTCLAALISDAPGPWESSTTCPFAEALEARTKSLVASNGDTSVTKTEQTTAGAD